MAHTVEREIFGVGYRETTAFKDTYGGEVGHVFIECLRIKPANVESDTVLVFSHPIGGGAFLPAITQLARAGHHVLVREHALSRQRQRAHHGEVPARSRRGHQGCERALRLLEGSARRMVRRRIAVVVLPGASRTHDRSTERRPATRSDLAGAKLIPGDGIMLMAAHVSRSVTLTEWMDASIVDELDIGKRNAEFNLYDPANPNRAPYNAEFLARYRAAQVARNRRITDWVKTELAARIRADGPGAERGFVVHGTMADPRWLDATVDPNDREPGTCYLGDPRIVNMGPVGLARFCTLRSWLSQWSFDESRANGTKNAQNVTCPVLVIGNTADNACTPSHTHRLYEAVGHKDKELREIKGATHYYAGQPKHCAEAIDVCSEWLSRKGFSNLERSA